MNRHIAIVGFGRVGSALGYTLINKGLVSHLTIIDTNNVKATSHALDLRDAFIALNKDVSITVNDTKDMLKADIIVVAIGPANITSLDRLDEFHSNKMGIQTLAETLGKAQYPGIVLNITNPCDVITQVLQVASGLPKSRVFGTGTTLDSLRLQRLLGEHLDLNPADIDGYMAGEHGDSQFVAWSPMRMAGVPAEQWNISDDDKVQIESDVMRSGAVIFNGKGCTEFGIGAMAASICQAIFHDSQKIYSLSVYDESAECYISHPTQVGKTGLGRRFTLKLNDKEQARLEQSAQIIRQYVAME